MPGRNQLPYPGGEDEETYAYVRKLRGGGGGGPAIKGLYRYVLL